MRFQASELGSVSATTKLRENQLQFISMPMLYGTDPDQKGAIETIVKVGWKVVGVFFGAAVVGTVLMQLGITVWRLPRTTLDVARNGAFAMATLNVALWMWFPLNDLQVLRDWARTKRKRFAHHTAQFLTIMTVTFLLLLMIVGALTSAFWFGIAGVAVYTLNFLGFAYIRNEVRDAVRESRALIQDQPPSARGPLSDALQAVESHWTTASTHLLSGWQQARHLTIVMCFVVVASLGLTQRPVTQAVAYWLGTGTLLIAEISIALKRIARDRVLHRVDGEIDQISETAG